jgi:hypothetical protein
MGTLMTYIFSTIYSSSVAYNFVQYVKQSGMEQKLVMKLCYMEDMKI